MIVKINSFTESKLLPYLKLNFLPSQTLPPLPFPFLVIQAALAFQQLFLFPGVVLIKFCLFILMSHNYPRLWLLLHLFLSSCLSTFLIIFPSFSSLCAFDMCYASLAALSFLQGVLENFSSSSLRWFHIRHRKKFPSPVFLSEFSSSGSNLP